MDEQTSIRPECLRPANDFWIRPEANEVREVLRRGKLTGAKAAQILGLGTGGSRTIRRYTGGDAAIPYASWAILCEVAGLGRIWQAEGGSPPADAPPSSSTPPSADELAEAFGRAEEFIERIWTGQDAASVATIGDCRDALVRMKQAWHAMSTREQPAGLGHARLEQRIAAAQDRVKTMSSWVDLS
ncbi:hypothetical protein [Paraburkholderia pallida]|uniref:hypothetical protein n=1 Tax=Paraburkholderia pallida TaxID=2547399 RepID=UPI00268B3520